MKHDWLQHIVQSPAVTRIAESLSPGTRTGAEGAYGSSAHLLAGALRVRTGRPVLLVVAHLDDADEAADDLALFEGVEAVIFPALELMPGESNVSLELLADRLSLVSRLIEKDQPAVIVAPVQALMQAVPEPGAIGAIAKELRRGQKIEQAALTRWLADAGYRRSDAIDEPGDFTVRGGIIDIYPPGNQPPVRLDFFGDEIDEIAQIDPDSMSSDRKLPAVRLIGASADAARSDDRTTGLWSMLAADTLVVMHETLEIDEQSRGYYERLSDPVGVFPPRAVQQHLGAFAVLEVNQFASPAMTDRLIRLPVTPLMNFEHDAAKAVRELGELAAESDVRVICQREAEADRLRELLREHSPGAEVEIDVGYLYRGFTWIADCRLPIADLGTETNQRSKIENRKSLTLVPHHELFHRYQARRRVRRVGGTRAVETFLDIEPGDYVVHSHHGVALFRGLRMMTKGRDTREEGGEEYLTLEFADRALLHVPASQIELVHRYVGGFSGKPPLSKLGGARWKKQKEQAAEAAKQLAAELLRVQAARAAMPGIRYPPDTPWMTRFEAEFPYQETDDQLAAVAEIKKDMSDPQPMDRLICGDVGYGKTELAMRAVFKAVESGKQAAVLCPTTVLCEQHYRTFRDRMADYPFHTAAINRLKTDADARRTLEGLRDGSVDIVIGTHRLLSNDVRFADLGLIVVDEEQKFGVEHKNKLMRFRVTVDVLTLSATPIPRTLHMALLGLRDISSLSTPPADRRAVVTEVVPYDAGRVRQAILRELNRGGQCYYVHNRVHNIRSVAAELQTLVPEARILVGHGQMAGRELEGVMLDFVNHQADVLVCTTIIESGIDIPAANTMFIADCDRFGLAELHQLRGRVGRYKHRAYCYMLLPRTRPLSEVALRRMRAIEQYSMLGAGFKIAMRDMEIRGVGNLLGPEQSGHIAAVGYAMYCDLLEEMTAKLKDQPLASQVDTHLELKIAGHLPKQYIPSDKHRMEAYRRVTRARDLDTLRQVERSLAEAYGDPPKPVQLLLALAEIRIALSRLGVESLKLEGPDLIFATRDVQRLSPLLEPAPGTVRLVDTPSEDRPGTVYYRPPPKYVEQSPTLLAVLRKLLVTPTDSPPSRQGRQAGRQGERVLTNADRPEVSG